MTVSSELLSVSIGRIYDCAVDPGRLPDALSHVYPAVGCANASLELIDIRTSRPVLSIHVGIADGFVRTMIGYAPDVVRHVGRLGAAARPADGGSGHPEPDPQSRPNIAYSAFALDVDGVPAEVAIYNVGSSSEASVILPATAGG